MMEREFWFILLLLESCKYFQDNLDFMTFYNPNYLPKAQYQSTIMLKVNASTYEFFQSTESEL